MPGCIDETVELAADVIASMPGDSPILVNSAGCGAALEDYGRVLGTDEARRFSARVYDVHEWIAERLDDLPELRRRPARRRSSRTRATCVTCSVLTSRCEP